MLSTLLRWYGGASRSKPDNKNSSSSKNLSRLYDGDRGLLDLHLNTAELRLWLPVPVKNAIDECLVEMDITASKYIREYFVEYLYGAHELLKMRAESTGLYYKEPPKPVVEKKVALPPDISDGGIQFSRNEEKETIPGLGKNIVPMKIFVSSKIKSDLEALAVKAKFPLGSFVRELLVSHFLGHTVWAERNPAWTTAEQKDADDWVEGKIDAPFEYGLDQDR